ncbi:hypothetical protein BH23CHL6_BH23CHL6_00030 [soil metagenome]
MELEQDLRSTSDDLLRRLERLRDLEMEKRQLTPGSPHFRRLAAEIERLAAGVLVKSVEQDQLGQVAGAVLEETETVSPPIAEIPPRRDIALILGDWREAERRLSACSPGTPEHSEAQAAVQRLRAEYRDTHQVAARQENG